MKNHERRSSFHARCALWVAIGCAVFAPLACGDDDPAPGPTGGSGGTGGTGGTAGASGSAGTGGGDPDGATGAMCGGIASIPCPDPDVTFCDYDDKEDCGMGDIMGVCTPRPGNCTEDCPGICGCDGIFYCNACKAHQAGKDTLPEGTGTCMEAGTLR